MTAGCAIAGCQRALHARGWCITHYQRWRKTGTTADPLTTPVLERFHQSYQAVDDCWLWAGRLTKGYGRFHLSGHQILAHRASYELLIGPIPAGLHVDHLCNQRACVNPAHLEAVTQAENNRRILARGRHHMVNKTHCPRGHEYTTENTYMTPARRNRLCRTCRYDQWLARENRQRIARGEEPLPPNTRWFRARRPAVA